MSTAVLSFNISIKYSYCYARNILKRNSRNKDMLRKDKHAPMHFLAELAESHYSVYYVNSRTNCFLVPSHKICEFYGFPLILKISIVIQSFTSPHR